MVLDEVYISTLDNPGSSWIPLFVTTCLGGGMIWSVCISGWFDRLRRSEERRVGKECRN